MDKQIVAGIIVIAGLWLIIYAFFGESEDKGD